MSEGMTINELAQLVGMTPRNIRAYQSRGLLFPPEIHGRVARYGGAHAARLELVASLQREGFTLAAIKRLIDAPATYASIVADRRRGVSGGALGSPTPVPISERTLEGIRPGLTAEFERTGLVWREDGRLCGYLMLAGLGRALDERGADLGRLMDLVLDVARDAGRAGLRLREVLSRDRTGAAVEDRPRDDLSLIGVQLLVSVFEVASTREALARTGP
jgi:DNA-binding transcriptional MerR regulator